jgi:predicted RNA-binding protein YlxR (DUF448 family)
MKKGVLSPQQIKARRVPVRTCIACRKVDGKRTLRRFVRTTTGVEFDPGGKKAGRGAYLCAEIDCWQNALQRNLLGRALRCEITAEDIQRMETHMKELAPAAPAKS